MSSGDADPRRSAVAVEHVLGMLAAGDSVEMRVSGRPWREREEVLAFLEYAGRLVAHERVERFDVSRIVTCRAASCADRHSPARPARVAPPTRARQASGDGL
jgi:uncharacterized protein (DUF433 family)